MKSACTCRSRRRSPGYGVHPSKKVAVFATGVRALRRWVENIWPSFRDILEARPLPAGLLVMALEITDRETANLFGIGQEELALRQAAVLV